MCIPKLLGKHVASNFRIAYESEKSLRARWYPSASDTGSDARKKLSTELLEARLQVEKKFLTNVDTSDIPALLCTKLFHAPFLIKT